MCRGEFAGKCPPRWNGASGEGDEHVRCAGRGGKLGILGETLLEVKLLRMGLFEECETLVDANMRIRSFFGQGGKHVDALRNQMDDLAVAMNMLRGTLEGRTKMMLVITACRVKGGKPVEMTWIRWGQRRQETRPFQRDYLVQDVFGVGRSKRFGKFMKCVKVVSGTFTEKT